MIITIYRSEIKYIARSPTKRCEAQVTLIFTDGSTITVFDPKRIIKTNGGGP